MNHQNLTYADLCHRHCWMYAPKRADGLIETIHIGHGIECGPGWLPLLDDALTRIGEEAHAMPEEQCARFALVQIKEKYGALCIYYRDGNKRIAEIIEQAEALSERTCEECGDYALPRVFDDEWYSTLCAARARKRSAKRGGVVRIERRRSDDN